jgi:hypothetical protein
MDVLGVDVKVDATADLTPAVKAGSDIATNTHKGVSKLFYALCGPWMEGRVRKAELIAAQTSKDCADIKNGLVTYTGENVIPFEPQATVASSFEALHKLNHASDAKRLHAAMQEAARQISEVPEEQVSDEPLSQDFFNHWRREAEMIDDEALRQWWARLLVEETKTPKSILPRTLDVARDLSKAEAEIFQRMLRGSINDVIPIGEREHPQYINYAEALMMGDAGLLMAKSSWVPRGYIALKFEEGKYFINLPNADGVICTVGEDFQLDCFLLTQAGQQLARLAIQRRDLNTVTEIAKFLKGRISKSVFESHERLPSQGAEIAWRKTATWSSVNDAAENSPAQGVTK